MDDEALAQIRKAVSKEWVLGNERFRQEIEQALGRKVTPRKQGRRKGEGGIDGEQIGLDFDR